jgi:hypothetical protein
VLVVLRQLTQHYLLERDDIMASAASNPAYSVSFQGQNNNTGDVRDLFLKLYAGEVLTAFEEKKVIMDKVRTRTISKGKSASFPMTGRASAEYLTPGNEITGGQIRAGERIVTIDDLLISSQFIANIDEAINHYDVRSIYSKEAGIALANEADRNVARMLVKASLSTNAARAAGLIQDYKSFTEEDFTNNVVIGDNAADDLVASDIAQAIFNARKEMEKKNVPTDGAVVMLPPDQYYALLDVTDGNKLVYMNRDFGGEGSIASATVPSIAGMPVYMSNHADVTNLYTALAAGAGEGVTSDNAPLANTAGSGRTTHYDLPTADVDGADMVALAARIRGFVFTPDAVATVKLMDLGLESEYQINRQGTLMVAKYAMGHNVLRPASAIALLEYA